MCIMVYIYKHCPSFISSAKSGLCQFFHLFLKTFSIFHFIFNFNCSEKMSGCVVVLVLKPIVSIRTQAYRCVSLRGGLSKGSQPVFTKDLWQSESKYFQQMLFDSSEAFFMFLKLLIYLPPKKVIRFQVTNCISLSVNLETYCSFELFLIFQNVIIQM